MEIQGGGGPPYIQAGHQLPYQGGGYDQGIHNQLAGLSLQDPAFLQELQRLEQPQQLQPQFVQQQQVLQPQVQQVQGVPVYAGGGSLPGSLPGNLLPPGDPAAANSATVRKHDEVGELSPEEVRWCYRKEAAPGTSPENWVAFDGYDSLRTEIRYRHIWQTRWRSQNMQQTRRAQSLNRHYERSQAESYSGGSSEEYNLSDPCVQGYRQGQTFNSHPPRRKFSPSLAARHGKISKRHYRSEELIGDDRDFYIVVRGGIWEVDLKEWKCNSVYWPGPGLEIMRGTWFHDTSWQPVDCEHADRIEAEHIKRFMGHKMADYIWDPTKQCRREVQVQHSIRLESIDKIRDKAEESEDSSKTKVD